MVGNGWLLGVVTGAFDYDLKSLAIASARPVPHLRSKM